MTKLFNNILMKNLSYDEAKKLCKENGYFFTRLEWHGFHYIKDDNTYLILNKDKEILINPLEIYDIDKNDWVLVDITIEAFNILKYKNLLNDKTILLWLMKK